jgi:AraC-like DNA-binding protein
MIDDSDPDTVQTPTFVLTQRRDALDEPWHASGHIQFVQVVEGVLTVHAENGRWAVPPHHGLWLPAGVLHRVSSQRPVLLRTLFVAADALRVPVHCEVVSVDPLVGELLCAASRFAADHSQDGEEARLFSVIADRLRRLEPAPLGLRYPRDPRIARITDALSADPADAQVLDDFARVAGVTARTAARLFVKETGLTFGRWRQQLRLLIALQRLGAGASVTRAALEVGYTDVSSFIAVFKDALGETPARYFR